MSPPAQAALRLGRRIRFVLLPDYSFAALAAAIEPLRLANLLSARELFSWRTASLAANAVRASNGTMTVADDALQDCREFDTAIICSGSHFYPAGSADLCRLLRRWHAEGIQIGAICSATALLAKAGLLHNRRATIHWASASAFREEFPEIPVSDHLFEIDAPIFTAGCAEAVCDLMLHLIERRCGKLIAGQIANHLSHPIIRGETARQTISMTTLLGARHLELDKILRVMEANIEDPVSHRQMSRLSGLSLRQAQRLFKRHLGMTPAAYYRKLRLQRARYLLLQTSMTITEVAVATGFASPSYFSRIYRTEFNDMPSRDWRIS